MLDKLGEDTAAVRLTIAGQLRGSSQLDKSVTFLLTKTMVEFDGLSIVSAEAVWADSDDTLVDGMKKALCGSSVEVTFTQNAKFTSIQDRSPFQVTVALGPNATSSLRNGKCGPSVSALSGVLVVANPMDFGSRCVYGRVKAWVKVVDGDKWDPTSASYISTPKWQGRRAGWGKDHARSSYDIYVTKPFTSNELDRMDTVLQYADLRAQRRKWFTADSPFYLGPGFRAGFCHIIDLSAYDAFPDVVGVGVPMDSELSFATVDAIHTSCNKDPNCGGFTTYLQTQRDGTSVEIPWTRHMTSTISATTSGGTPYRKVTKTDKYQTGLVFYLKPAIVAGCRFVANTLALSADVFVEQTLLGTGYVSVFANGKFVTNCGGPYLFIGDGNRDVKGEDGNCNVYKLCTRLSDQPRSTLIEVIPNGGWSTPCNHTVSVLVNVTRLATDPQVDDEEPVVDEDGPPVLYVNPNDVPTTLTSTVAPTTPTRGQETTTSAITATTLIVSTTAAEQTTSKEQVTTMPSQQTAATTAIQTTATIEQSASTDRPLLTPTLDPVTQQPTAVPPVEESAVLVNLQNITRNVSFSWIEVPLPEPSSPDSIEDPPAPVRVLVDGAVDIQLYVFQTGFDCSKGSCTDEPLVRMIAGSTIVATCGGARGFAGVPGLSDSCSTLYNCSTTHVKLPSSYSGWVTVEVAWPLLSFHTSICRSFGAILTVQTAGQTVTCLPPQENKRNCGH